MNALYINDVYKHIMNEWLIEIFYEKKKINYSLLLRKNQNELEIDHCLAILLLTDYNKFQ